MPGDAAEWALLAELPVRHPAARGPLLASLAARLSVADWAAGVPDSALLPHLSVVGLSLGEARALGLVAPLRALASTAVLASAVASGVLRPRVQFALPAGPAVLLAQATWVWSVDGRLQVLLLVPGVRQALSAEAFAVTSSVLWHAAEASSARPRVGLSFVDAPDAEPFWVEEAPLSRTQLGLAATELLAADAGLPEGRPLAVCEALGCGFRSRCHALAPAASGGAPTAL